MYKHIVSIFLEIILYSTILLRKEKMYYNVILIIIFLFTIYLHSRTKESFQTQSSKEYHIADNQNNVKGSYTIDKNVYHKAIISLKKQGHIDKELLGLTNQNIVIYVDPYINYYILGNRENNILDYNDGIFICLSFKKLDKTDCIWNLENKIIAYNYLSDYLFIQALIKAYRLDFTKIKLIKINDSDLKSVNKIFDFFFTYVVIDSDYMKLLETSLYYINGMIDIDINRVKPFYPFIKENYKSMREYFSKETIKEYIYDPVSLIPIMNYKIMTFNESFITRLKLPEGYIGEKSSKSLEQLEYNESALGYGCYGNQKVNNIFECNSKFNIDGTAKPYYSLWDKKCNAHDECPFYKANTKYENERGGCKDGFCELPNWYKKIRVYEI